MNDKQALEASKNNPAEVNKVLERLDVECPKCKGNGWQRPERDFERVSSDCHKCNGKGKTSYTCTPQVGEWCLYRSEARLITRFRENKWVRLSGYKFEIHRDAVTPILEWEEIEEILEKAGYEVWVHPHYTEPHDKRNYYCIIKKDNKRKRILFEVKGKSRIEAVYEAVLTLGKEIEK